MLEEAQLASGARGASGGGASGRWRRGLPLLRSEDAGRVVPEYGIWLDGPAASPTHVGVRGYSYGPFEQREAFATDAYVLIFYMEGSTEVTRVIGVKRETCRVAPGDVSLHPSSVVSRWRWRSPVDVLHVYLEPAYLQRIAQETMGGVTALDMRHALRVADPPLAQMGVEMVRELTAPRPLGSERTSQALGDRIGIHLLRHYFDLERTDLRERTFSSDEMHSFRAWLAEHLGEELHLERMASQLQLDVYRFSRIFRSSFGQSPHGYVREQRLTRARELLLSTGDALSSIAVHTGFADQSHLTRCFKRHFGVPPGQLRRRNEIGASGGRVEGRRAVAEDASLGVFPPPASRERRLAASAGGIRG